MLEMVRTLAQDNGGDGGLMSGAIGLIILGVVLAAIVAIIAGTWKMFEKAGQPGWASLIPIYNTIVLLEIIGRPVWWIVLLMIPCVNAIVACIVMNDLAKSFGKGTDYTIGLILLGFIFMPLLGFGDPRYRGPAVQS